MPKGIGYGKKKKRGFKKGTLRRQLRAETKPGAVDDDAKKRMKRRKRLLELAKKVAA